MSGDADRASEPEAAPGTPVDLAIGAFAELMGVPTHVLRHWEDEDLLRPRRDGSGYRRYGRDEVTRVLLVGRSRHAGMSLAQIRALVDTSAPGRREILRAHLAELDQREADLRHSRAMTEHALECRAHDVTTCPRFVAMVGELSSGRARAPRMDGLPAAGGAQ